MARQGKAFTFSNETMLGGRQSSKTPTAATQPSSLQVLSDDDNTSDLREAFSLFDADGSGSITIDELGDVLKKLGLYTSREDLLKVVEDLDQAGSGKITFEDFRQLMTEKFQGGLMAKRVLSAYSSLKADLGCESFTRISGFMADHLRNQKSGKYNNADHLELTVGQCFHIPMDLAQELRASDHAQKQFSTAPLRFTLGRSPRLVNAEVQATVPPDELSSHASVSSKASVQQEERDFLAASSSYTSQPQNSSKNEILPWGSPSGLSPTSQKMQQEAYVRMYAMGAVCDPEFATMNGPVVPEMRSMHPVTEAAASRFAHRTGSRIRARSGPGHYGGRAPGGQKAEQTKHEVLMSVAQAMDAQLRRLQRNIGESPRRVSWYSKSQDELSSDGQRSETEHGRGPGPLAYVSMETEPEVEQAPQRNAQKLADKRLSRQRPGQNPMPNKQVHSKVQPKAYGRVPPNIFRISTKIDTPGSEVQVLTTQELSEKQSVASARNLGVLQEGIIFV